MQSPREQCELRAWAEGAQRGPDGWELHQRVANATQFARIRQPILESTENTGDVPHGPEVLVQFGETHGLADQFAHQGLSSSNFRQIERRCREPAFEQAGPGGGYCAIDGLQQGALAVAGRGRENLEVTERCRVEQESSGAAI